MNYTEKGSKLYLFSIVLVAVIGGLLFGYDTAVISGADKGLQAFFMGASDFVYTDTIHGITSSSALIGCIIGSALSGFFASNLGRKNSLFIAGVLFFLSALGSYYPEFLFFDYGVPSYSLLVAFNFYRVLGGIGVGLASAICPMYIAEIAPSNIRGTLVSWNQFAIIFGQLVVYFVNFLILGENSNPVIKAIEGVNQILNPEAAAWTTEIGWRLMFVSEAVPAGVFALLVLFVPETPRYLAMSGKDDKALQVLSRINGLAQAKVILSQIKGESASGVFVSKKSLGNSPQERIDKGALPPSNKANQEKRVALGKDQNVISGKIAQQPSFKEQDPAHGERRGGGKQVVTAGGFSTGAVKNINKNGGKKMASSEKDRGNAFKQSLKVNVPQGQAKSSGKKNAFNNSPSKGQRERTRSQSQTKSKGMSR